MPDTNSNSLLRLDIYNKIIQGKYTTNEQNLTVFEKFLNILNTLPLCPTTSPVISIGRPPIHIKTTQIPPPCIQSGENPIIEKIKFFNDLTKNNHLKNSFNYLKSVIDQQASSIQTDNIEKLLQLCNTFFRISLTNLGLTSIEINDISQAYFDFFVSITKLPESIHISLIDGNNPEIFNLMSLSTGYFYKLSKLNVNASKPTESSNLTYPIYEPLKSYLGGLGNLTLNFRNEYPESELNRFENNAAKLVSSMTLLTDDQLSDIRHTFLSQYHSKADLLTACKRLFNTTDCDPYKFNTLFKLICQGKSVSNFLLAEIILKKMLFGSEADIMERLKSLIITIAKNNGLANFLDFFKAMVNEVNQNGQSLSADYVKDLSSLTFYLTDVFKDTKPKSKIYNSLFSLVLTLLKNPSADHQFWHVWKAIEACGNQMKDLLKNPQPGIDSSMNILSSIFHQANNIDAMSPAEKREIGNVIGELSLACLKIDSCNSFSALNQFSKNLGAMVSSLFKQNRNQIEEQAAKEIETIVQQIFQNASNKLSELELKGIAWTFLKQRYDKKDHAIQMGCKRLFKLNDCHEFIVPNIITEPDFIPSTIIPEAVTNSTTPISTTTTSTAPAINTTMVPSINNTISTDIVNTTHATNLPGDIDIQTSPSDSETNAHDYKQFSLGSKIGTAMGLGGFAGFLNGSSQVLLHIAERKNCSINTQRLLAVTLAIANSFAICTLPLIYSIVEDFANEQNDPLVNSQKLFTCTYAFITSIVLQSINAGVHYALPKKSILKNLVNFMPLFASLWMLANGEEGVVETLSILGTNILTSIGVSAATQAKGQKLYAFFNSTQNEKYNTEKNDTAVEMQSLNEENNGKAITNGVNTESKTEKTYQYITEEKFNKIKKQSEGIIKALAALVNLLNQSIENNRVKIESDTIPAVADAYQKIIDDKSKVLQIIKQEVESCKKEISFLEDDHRNAYQNHIIENIHTPNEKKKIKLAYTSAMEKLGNVFKRMEPMFINMQKKLDKAKGFVEGAHTSFAGVDHTLDELNNILETIEFPLSLTKLYVSAYNTWHAAELGEKNGVEKVLANQERFNNATPIVTATLRRKTSGIVTNNRACSMYSNRTRSSESDKSDTSGNSEFDPLVFQQERELIRPNV